MEPLLLSLRIENLALIEKTELELVPGLNVLTGETGAGKTMLAKALEVLLGAKTPKEVVRPGAQAAYIEAVFCLPKDLPVQSGLEEILEDCAGEISLARRIAAEGKSRCMVEGRTVSLETLRELATSLVAFYGQHEGREILLDRVQTSILDGSGDGRGSQLYQDYLASRQAAVQAENHWQKLRQEHTSSSREVELARYELGELEDLSPLVGEEEELHRELRRLSGALVGGQACQAAGDLLQNEEGGVVELIGDSVRSLQSAGEPVAHLLERLHGLQIEIADLASELEKASQEWEADPERQATVEARLAELSRLGRKHGVEADDLIQVQESLREKVQQADLAPLNLEKAEKDKQEALRNAFSTARKLSDWRKNQSPRLSKIITKSLEDLAMAGAVFTVSLEDLPGEDLSSLGPTGREKVEFQLQANPGLPSLPLSQVASGGEISRLMLALVSASRAQQRSVLILDEPDVGLGGNTAHGVAARLKALSKDNQLLVISHLPQIAAGADRLFCVEKEVGDKETTTRVRTLQADEEIIDELCRMAGHNREDQSARKVAKDLRKKAQA